MVGTGDVVRSTSYAWNGDASMKITTQVASGTNTEAYRTFGVLPKCKLGLEILSWGPPFGSVDNECDIWWGIERDDGTRTVKDFHVILKRRASGSELYIAEGSGLSLLKKYDGTANQKWGPHGNNIAFIGDFENERWVKLWLGEDMWDLIQYPIYTWISGSEKGPGAYVYIWIWNIKSQTIECYVDDVILTREF